MHRLCLACNMKLYRAFEGALNQDRGDGRRKIGHKPKFELYQHSEHQPSRLAPSLGLRGTWCAVIREEKSKSARNIRSGQERASGSDRVFLQAELMTRVPGGATRRRVVYGLVGQRFHSIRAMIRDLNEDPCGHLGLSPPPRFARIVGSSKRLVQC